MIDIIGHIGYLLIFVGMILIARSERLGWVLRFIGEFVWVYIGFALDMTSIWMWGFIFMFCDVYGLIKWSK